ncbi:MAG: hypothetical protein ACK41P_01205 [Asticcacaulis sp.]
MTDTPPVSERNIPSLEELEAEAWQRWHEADYSWEGLKRIPWKGINRKLSYNRHSKSHQYGKNLQDYWLWDPATNKIRTESELINNKELIVCEGKKTYHIAHLPPFYNANDLSTASIKHKKPNLAPRVFDIIKTRLEHSSYSDDQYIAMLDGVVLYNFEFYYDTLRNFINFHFSGEVNDNLRNFNASLQYAIILGNTYLNFNFLQGTTFYNAYFKGEVNISGRFAGNAKFSQSRFLKHATFNCEFSGNYLSHGAKYLNNIVFATCIFNQKFSNSQAEYASDLNFYNCRFEGIAELSSACYFQNLNIYNCMFKEDINLYNSLILNTLNLQDAKFYKNVNINQVDNRKMQHFNISGSTFETRLLIGDNFSKAKFSSFQNCQFRDGIIIPYVKYEEENFKYNNELESILKDKETNVEKNLNSLESGLRVLKIASSFNKDTTREHFYNSLEIKTRCNRLSTPWIEKFSSSIYDTISDNGNSIHKPLIIHLIAIYFFFQQYMIYFNDAGAINCDTFYYAISASIGRSIPFTAFSDLIKEYTNNLYGAPDPWRAFWFTIVGILQTFISTVLIFLTGLAIRRRFQVS